MPILKRGTILFHGTVAKFKRIKGPAFFAPTLSLAWQEAFDPGRPDECKVLIFIVKKDIESKTFRTNFWRWMLAAYSMKRTKDQAYEHIRRFKHQAGYKEIVIRTPSKVLGFLGTIPFKPKGRGHRRRK